jgi:hypothetical protein
MIWLDCLTPKQAQLAYFFHRELKDQYDFLITYRENAETQNVIFERKLHTIAHKVGKHGHTTLDKASFRIARQCELMSLLNKYPIKLLITHASPSATHVAYSRGIPIILMNDTPWALNTNRLTLPFANHFVCSEAFRPTNQLHFPWHDLGLARTTPVSYFNGVDEVLWVREWQKTFDPQSNWDRPVIAVRAPEQFAAYADKKFPTVDAILEGLEAVQKALVVKILTRNLQTEYPSTKYLEIETIDYTEPLRLYKKINGFIGIGGTMNREAAMLGLPSLSLFYFRYVNPYVRKLGFPLYHHFPYGVQRAVQHFANALQTRMHTASQYVNKMETPLKPIKEGMNQLGFETGFEIND